MTSAALLEELRASLWVPLPLFFCIMFLLFYSEIKTEIFLFKSASVVTMWYGFSVRILLESVFRLRPARRLPSSRELRSTAQIQRDGVHTEPRAPQQRRQSHYLHALQYQHHRRNLVRTFSCPTHRLRMVIDLPSVEVRVSGRFKKFF